MAEARERGPAWTLLDDRARGSLDIVRDLEAAIAGGATAVRVLGAIHGHAVLGVAGLAELMISGPVDGGIGFTGDGPCSISLDADVADSVSLATRGATVRLFGSVGGGVFIADPAGGPVEVFGPVAGQVVVRSDACCETLSVMESVQRLAIEGEVAEDVRVFGRVHRQLQISGRVRGSVLIANPADGGVSVTGVVDGFLSVSGEQSARLTVSGGVAGGVVLRGRFAESVTIAPAADRPTPLVSVSGARFDQAVHIGDRVSIVACDFRQCGDIDKLDLVGAHLFARPRSATDATELTKPEGASDGEMASIYRQLRVNLEGKGNRPASAFFYRGEMDSRRRAAWQRGGWAGRTEWAWISLYRWVAGYGLRVAPPLVSFLVLVGLGGLGFHAWAVHRDWPSTFVYTAQSMLSLFRPPDPSDDWRAGLLQIALRVLGPILLGLAALAVRDKVAR